MIDAVKDKCYGCTACFAVCPQKCISMVDIGEGFLYPKIDINRCVKCNLCEKVCPVINKPHEGDDFVTYAAYNKNDKIRKNCSSGGIFAQMAYHALLEKGIVYGAAFESDYQSVCHIRIESERNLPRLYTSKYMQSRLNDTYQLVRKDLKEGKKVLFSGTPCQVGGLKTFLGKEYENLLCVDFICHGVPSEKIWKIFTNKLIKKYNHKIDSANFRFKEDGSPRLLLLFGNHEYKQTQSENLFYQAFLSDICLRKSCYQCQFKGKYGFSDITIADFWGIQSVCPEMNDEKGTSLVIVNSSKGSVIWGKIKNETVFKKVNDERVLKSNSSRLMSVAYHPNRDRYMTGVNEENFKRFTIQCVGKPLSERIKIKLISILRNPYKLLFKRKK